MQVLGHDLVAFGLQRKELADDVHLFGELGPEPFQLLVKIDAVGAEEIDPGHDPDRGLGELLGRTDHPAGREEFRNLNGGQPEDIVHEVDRFPAHVGRFLLFPTGKDREQDDPGQQTGQKAGDEGPQDR